MAWNNILGAVVCMLLKDGIKKSSVQILYTNEKKQTPARPWWDSQSAECWAKKAIYKRFHLYKVQNQAKLTFGVRS